MSIASVGSFSPPSASPSPVKAESVEPKGPDRDGDADDLRAAAAAAPKGSATAAGIGGTIDVFA